jgi:hypothetical protein
MEYYQLHSVQFNSIQFIVVTAADHPFMLQKEDLIAELKMSKDITGIKKLKVERAKVEEQQEKEMFSEITRQLTANSFVEKVGFYFVLLATNSLCICVLM